MVLPVEAPGLPTVVNTSFGFNWLTVFWTPPSTGGVPTGYNVSINDSSSPVVIPDNGSLMYTYTYTGLKSDNTYKVSVVAINCAGQNVTSVSALLGIVIPKWFVYNQVESGIS